MKKIFVKDIIRECNAKLFYGNLNVECNNFSKDTRTIKKDDVYIGIKGNTFDGNSFYMEAFDKGASVCILEKKYFNEKDFDYKKYNNRTVILVNNSIDALQKIAHYKRSLYNIPVIAVTGSVGKTSTKDMIASVLSKKYNVLKTEGNLNNHIGLPLTILKLKNHDILILEMGMNHLNEISILSKIANPTISIITNIGTAHIGNLGSRKNIMKAKLEILDGMNTEGILIINNDNDLLNMEKDILKEKINLLTIGINNDSNFNAKDIKREIFSSEYMLENNKIRIEVGGIPFIYNSLFAFVCGKLLNVDVKNIIEGIKDFKLSNNRLEKLKLSNGSLIINDSYNASYDSVIAAIDMISDSKFKRKILLLGDILELGDYTEEIHRNIGKYIIKKSINNVILVGSNVKYIYDELVNNNFDVNNIYQFDSEGETYEFLKSFLKNDDIILIKGSHGINLINIVNYLKSYEH